MNRIFAQVVNEVNQFYFASAKVVFRALKPEHLLHDLRRFASF